MLRSMTFNAAPTSAWLEIGFPSSDSWRNFMQFCSGSRPDASLTTDSGQGIYNNSLQSDFF